MLKSASTLKEFSTKIKSAQISETLTPETVRDMAEEIMEIVTVAEEMAEEIAEGVPAEESEGIRREEEEEGIEQIEVAADETEEEKKKRMAREAQDGDDEDKKKIKELEASLSEMKRESTLAKLAPKYANLFPKSMHEAKMNEIIQSKQPLNIVEARIQEASEIINNKTMVKVASMNDSPYDFATTSDGQDEINVSGVL